MVLNVILDMASVTFGVIMLVLVLLTFMMSVIYYPCVKKVNAVCDVNVHVANDSGSESVQKKRKRTHETSSKLWHYRLDHISRGRIGSLTVDGSKPCSSSPQAYG
jgi:hypothetical protein